MTAERKLFLILIILVGFQLANILPAWGTEDCKTSSGVLPRPKLPVGTPDLTNPIQHVIVMMQENHSFDTYYGRLNQRQFYGADVDGITKKMFNKTSSGKAIHAHHETSLCVTDPEHGWDAIHQEWNNGAMDGFVAVNDARAIGYFDERDIPFYYDLANKFAIADRYFCSVLTQTFPNRFYLYTGTSFGHVTNDIPLPVAQFDQPTIFDALNKAGVSWAYYKDGAGYLALFQPLYLANLGKMKAAAEFASDLKYGLLPQVAFIDGNANEEDEHPNANIQVGQAFVAQHTQELIESRYWKNSVLFLTYDEGGGFFDHVAPPLACLPDNIDPALGSGSVQGTFNRLGIRVPFVAVSPFAKHHYVSHKVYDHTSILRFIESKFNIPFLSMRDANANNLSELFDFGHSDLSIRPDFTLAKITSTCPQSDLDELNESKNAKSSGHGLRSVAIHKVGRKH